MNKYLLLLVSIVFMTSAVKSQDLNDAVINLTCYSEISNIVEKIEYNKFGVHENATDSLDYELGERDLPTMPPPNTLAAYFLFQNNNEEVWSYEDYRKMESGDSNNNPYTHRYKLHMEWGDGNNHSFKWNFATSAKYYVKSAKIKSVIPEVDITVDMIEYDSLFLDNKYLNDFYIEITYYPQASDVNEEITNQLNLYPNPCNSLINIPINNYNNNYYIFDTNGNIVLDGIANESQINVNKLQSGVYYLIIKDEKYRFIKN